MYIYHNVNKTNKKQSKIRVGRERWIIKWYEETRVNDMFILILMISQGYNVKTH